MAFFSRPEELAAVVDGVHRGHAGSVVLIGSHGLGKTTVVKALAETAAVPSAFVTSSSAESEWPYSGVSAYLSSIDATLGSDLLATAQVDGLEGEPFGVAQRIEMILRRADLKEHIVIVDDADTMDRESQLVLGYVIRRKSSPRMHHVLTVGAVVTYGPFNGIPSICLEPLDERSLVRLGLENRPPTVSYVVVELVARSSHGNPLVFNSMLGQLSAEELDGEAAVSVPLKPGSALTKRTMDRFDSLAEPTLAALRILSCGPFLPLPVADEVEGLTMEAMEELIENGLVGRSETALHIVDCAAAGAVYWSLSAGQRLELHRMLMSICADRFPGISAWHATFADPNSRYLEAMLAESESLLRAGYANSAAVFVERALWISDGSHREQLVAVSKGFLSNAQYDLARRYLQFANGPQLSPEAKLEVAANLVFIDYMQFETISLRQIMSTVSEFRSTHPEICARLLCTAAVFYLELWELEKAQSMFERARAIGRAEQPEVEATRVILSWYAAVFSGQALPEITDLEQEARTVREAFGESASALIMARALTLGERYADARELLGNFLQFSNAKARIWTDMALHFQFANELRSGRYHRARDVADLIRAEQGSRRYFAIDNNLKDAALCVIGREKDAAQETIRETVKMLGAGQSIALEGRLACMQGRLALMNEEFELAVDSFARAFRYGQSLANPQLLRVHEDYVDALLMSGRREDAFAVAADLRAAAAAAPSDWASLVTAKLDAQLLEGEESVAAYMKLLDGWDDGKNSYLRARAMLSFATRLKELGYDRRSAEMHQDAAMFLRESGVRVSDHILVPGRPTGSSTPVKELLDEKELPVVQLLARGLKNRSIAKELFISVRTVELRLTSVYRKVGVKSRFELMRLVSAQFEHSEEEESA